MLYILPESDTTALPIEPGNDHASATVKVTDLEDGTFLWTVPCLPVLTIEWRKAEISWNGVVKKALVRASDQRVIQLKTPVCVTVSSSCSIEIEHDKYTVLWEWDNATDELHVVRPGISGDTNNDEGDSEDVDSQEGHSEDGDSADGDSEEEEEALVLHTLPFKVLGVAHKLERQEHLEAAFNKITKENLVVCAKIQPEPDNMFDANAIGVLIDYGLGFKHVGYIAQELTRCIHPVIKHGRLQLATVYEIKFRTAWAKTGYFMTLQLTCKGEWPSQVLRASKRVQ